ncbi:hypothetical protein NON20_15015 [Synechocystis sp. B12]|nr:hypothetical protein NON20_15015 [Synechocystis sp. B12]
MQELHQQGAKAIAITSCGQEVTVIGAEKTIPIRTEQWCIGQEDQLKNLLAEIDILVINHGVNVHQRRDG